VRVFENRMLWGMLILKMDEVTNVGEKCILMIKSRRMRGTGIQNIGEKAKRKETIRKT
jgi:hypothetical protein